MNRPHHFYKTWSESIVGSQLRSFTDRCNDAAEQARSWADAQGADSYLESPDGMAGGIAALIFDNTVAKDGYERIVNAAGEAFFLPLEGSDTEKAMYALPVISETELIAILHFQPRISKDGNPMPFSFGDQTPVLFEHQGWWYIDVPYAADADSLTEISDREFYRRRMARINTME